MSIDFEQDAQQGAAQPDDQQTGDTLKRIAALAELMTEQKRHVENLETQLAAAKLSFQRTEQEDLPELMREIGLAAVTLEDGSVVEVGDDVHCGITEERKPEAHGWLVKNGFGGLIKTQVTVAFARGEREAAEAFKAEIEESHPSYEAMVSEGVHASALKSFIKEQLEQGNPVPTDLFGVRPFNRAKLKVSRKAADKSVARARATRKAALG